MFGRQVVYNYDSLGTNGLQLDIFNQISNDDFDYSSGLDLNCVRSHNPGQYLQGL